MSRFENDGLALQRRWWLVLLAVVIAAGSTLVATAGQERLYRASTLQVVVPSAELTEADDVLRSIDTLDRRNLLATLARIPLTREAQQRASLVSESGSSPSRGRSYSVDTSVLPSTNVLRIEVEGPDPEGAAAFANALGLVLQGESRRMYRIFEVETLARAEVPRGSVYPDPRRNLFAGVVLGLIAGVGAAFLAERLSGASRPVREALLESKA